MKINPTQYLDPRHEGGYTFENVEGPQVLVLNGSLRSGSVNKGIISALEQIKSGEFFDKIHFHIPDLSLLPLFNTDLEEENSNPAVIQRESTSRL